MKKLCSLTAFILCASLLTMSFSAASVVDDAYDLYKKAAEKMYGVKSIEMYYTQKQTIGMESISVSIKTASDTRERINEDGGLEMSMKPRKSGSGDNSLFGSSLDYLGDSYYKNGYMYMNVGDNMKLKAKTSTSDLPGYFGEVNWNFKREAFKDASIERLASGRKIRFKTSYEDLGAISELHELRELLGEEDELDFKISDVSYTLTLDSAGALVSYSRSFSLSIVYEGETISISNTTSGRVMSVNQGRYVEFPADLSDYELVGSAGSLFNGLYYRHPA